MFVTQTTYLQSIADVFVLMKVLFVVLFSLAVSACSSTQAPVYSWFHPQGGEYLFAYDQDECVAELAADGTQLGTDTKGPFFDCMRDRGYRLVTAVVVTDPSLRLAEDLLANGE